MTTIGGFVHGLANDGRRKNIANGSASRGEAQITVVVTDRAKTHQRRVAADHLPAREPVNTGHFTNIADPNTHRGGTVDLQIQAPTRYISPVGQNAQAVNPAGIRDNVPNINLDE